MAAIAGRVALELEFLLAAKCRFFKRQLQVILQVAAALGRILALRAASSAKAAETTAGEHIEDVFKTAEAAIARARAAHARILMTELIIACALLRIGQDFVSLVDLFKPRFGFLVVGVQVRVAGLGRLAVCFFDLVIRGALGYAQHLVIISFICHSSHHLF